MIDNPGACDNQCVPCYRPCIIKASCFSANLAVSNEDLSHVEFFWLSCEVSLVGAVMDMAAKVAAAPAGSPSFVSAALTHSRINARVLPFL